MSAFRAHSLPLHATYAPTFRSTTYHDTDSIYVGPQVLNGHASMSTPVRKVQVRSPAKNNTPLTRGMLSRTAPPSTTRSICTRTGGLRLRSDASRRTGTTTGGQVLDHVVLSDDDDDDRDVKRGNGAVPRDDASSPELGLQGDDDGAAAAQQHSPLPSTSSGSQPTTNGDASAASKAQLNNGNVTQRRRNTRASHLPAG